MFSSKKFALIVVGLTIAFTELSVAVAQTSTAVEASATKTSKQVQKAQRKADRKAARAKKNAELSTLEKNGYQPGGDQTNYPQNIQAAEAKAAASASSGK